MRKFLTELEIPEEKHVDFLHLFSTFSGMLVAMMDATPDAKNYLTFQLVGNNQYELTIRRSLGKTPAEALRTAETKITALESELATLKELRNCDGCGEAKIGPVGCYYSNSPIGDVCIDCHKAWL